jgi:PiT family inorganic phosphate transporter
MTPGLFLLVVLALALGSANGANDVSKGIATLVGSGVSDFKPAVAWGTAWTVAGALAAAFASQGLVATFSGNGFLSRAPDGAAFLTAVSAGTVVWVLFASRSGLPVSTTHAIAGALAGAGVVAQGFPALHWSFLTKKVALPLALSPLISVALLYAIFPLFRRCLAGVERYCICLERRVFLQAPDSLVLMSVATEPVVAAEEKCEASQLVAGRLNVIDALHWGSSALTSFARGLNDTPKIVALGLVASKFFHVSGFPFYAAIAVAMGAGSLFAGLRVTETLAHRVTKMSHTEGFAANLVTTAVVGFASLLSLPVSTTHVSSGAIIGIGLHRGSGSVAWLTVREMALAWLVTVPAAGLLAAGIFVVIR